MTIIDIINENCLNRKERVDPFSEFCTTIEIFSSRIIKMYRLISERLFSSDLSEIKESFVQTITHYIGRNEFISSVYTLLGIR